MKLLLDTHTLIWLLNGDTSLSENAKNNIQQNSNSIFISIASVWEIAIKISIGKLILNCPLEELESNIVRFGIQILPLSFQDAIIISKLPFHHKDPFDRIIAAQSMNYKITIVSKDDVFKSYTPNVLW